jgi:hypothetical protein
MKIPGTPYIISCLSFFILCSTACEDFIKIDPPTTDLVKTTVFNDDGNAESAMLDIYFQMKTYGFASGSSTSISLFLSLTSDEQINYYTSSPELTAEYQQFNDNELLPNNSYVLSLWSEIYSCIYKANSVLEGLNNSTKVSNEMRDQLKGEAFFIRAFCYFYLVNIFGEVPLAVTTDYRINSELKRSPEADVYTQIVDDLIQSKNLLVEDYSASNNERTRVNKYAASALLARVYLFTEDWSNAENEAGSIIETTSLFNLESNLADVFLVSSSEAIFQFWSDTRPNDRGTFRFFDTPLYGAIRPTFIESFEEGDARKSAWSSLTPSGYYRTLKYYSAADNPPLQYSTVLRLAEQYLIRAESRVRLNKLEEAREDINTIRQRTGLEEIAANDVSSLLKVIEEERKAELFNEWGHRWLDLKRMNRAGSILSPIKLQWSPEDTLFPIPEYEIRNNLGLKGAQNPGY